MKCVDSCQGEKCESRLHLLSDVTVPFFTVFVIVGSANTSSIVSAACSKMKSVPHGFQSYIGNQSLTCANRG